MVKVILVIVFLFALFFIVQGASEVISASDLFGEVDDPSPSDEVNNE